MGIEFNYPLCLEALQKALGLALYSVAKKYILESQSSMQTPEGADDIQDISLDDVKIVASAVSISVIGGAWAAMDNYGKGSLMDDSNPALEDYKNSELWNELRTNNTIVGRKKDYYTNIFGKQAYSEGKQAGKNIEGYRDVEPMHPSYAFQVAAKWLQNYIFAETVHGVINEFPFDLFFVTDGT